MNYLNKLELLIFIILIYLSLFNGYIISMFTRVNTSWHFYGSLFVSASIFLIFILIYSIRVSRFRNIFDERIYCLREIFWNISMLMVFLVLSTTYMYHSYRSPNQLVISSLISSIAISSFVIFYLTIYLALSKPFPSILDRIMIWIFIGTTYTTIWMFILITAFNILIIMPFIFRVLGIHRDEVLIAEEIAKNIVINEYTPFTLLLIVIFITMYELYKVRSLNTR